MTDRWRATVNYRTEAGTVDVVHDLSEIRDLHDLIENGPHWDTIEQIVIVRINHVTDTNLTVEGAERQ